MLTIFVITSCTSNVMELTSLESQEIESQLFQDQKDYVTSAKFDLKMMQKEAPEFKVENGILKFPTMEDYLSTYKLLNKKNQKELLEWSKSNGYSSLLSSYQYEDSVFMSTFIPTRDYEPGEDAFDKSERLSSLALSTLYNEKGLLLINDTIFKLRGPNVYVILNNDFAKVNEIDKASNIESLKNITNYKHTLDSKDQITTRAFNYTNKKRSNLIQVSSKRREYVEFNQERHWVGPGGPWYWLETNMKGQAQTKSLGVWWPNFNDEIYKGSVKITAINGQNTNFPYYIGTNVVTIWGYDEMDFLNVANLSIVSEYYFQKNQNYPEESCQNLGLW